MLGAGTTAPFEVVGPDGKIDGAGTVATLNIPALKFEGFYKGDRFLIAIDRPHPAADLYEPLNLMTTNGTQVACAILIAPLTSDEVAAGTTKQKTVLARLREVRLDSSAPPSAR